MPQPEILKKTMLPLLAIALLAGCVETPKSDRVSMGAAPGKTAIETIASMKPENLTPLFGRFAKPDAPRNENGEVEITMGAGRVDQMPTINAAAANVCASISMALIQVEELPPDKDGVRQIAFSCK